LRRFFILSPDSRQTAVHALVPTYPTFDVNFEYYEVSKCHPLPDDYLLKAQLLEKPGKKVDFVGNPLGWPIVSPTMLDIFSEFGTGSIQGLRFNAVDSSGKPVLENYRVINVLCCLSDVVSLEASVTSRHRVGDKETLNIITPVFRVCAVPETIHVFRPNLSLFMLVVSQEFAEKIEKAKIKGAALIETGSV
jgi:hypothetical protein